MDVDAAVCRATVLARKQLQDFTNERAHIVRGEDDGALSKLTNLRDKKEAQEPWSPRCQQNDDASKTMRREKYCERNCECRRRIPAA